MISEQYKLKIAEILNEDLIHKNKWTRRVNYFIIIMIIASAIQIILEVDPKYDNWQKLFEWLDILSIGIFSIEYLLRLWTSGVYEARYRGLKGKLRYIYSFYALIDLAAILPFYLSLILVGKSLTTLRILRVIRILRLARFMKSFDFIVKASQNKKSELLISMQIVVLLTFVLSVLLYHVENQAQPNNFATIWSAMLWSFSKFIGDIGGYGDFTPVTTAGMILATGVGILSIAIFAVPAGIIASGFVEEIEAEKEDKEINEKVKIIESSFTETKNELLGIKIPKRFRTLPELQSRLNYTDNEIFLAVRKSNKLRIKWEKSDPKLRISDMIVLEYFDTNTEYGVRNIVEGSNINIINPIGRGERGISHFSNVLSLCGEYNLISNELYSSGEILPDRKFRLDINPTYATMKPEGPQGAMDFMLDSTDNITKDDWVFIMRTSAGYRESDLHVLYGGVKGDVSFDMVKNPTVNNPELLKQLIRELDDSLGSIGHKVCTHEEFRNESPNLLHQYIRQKSGANVVTLFVSVDVVTADNRVYYQFLKTLSKSISKVLRT
jgi:voltage-gated potassium channel